MELEQTLEALLFYKGEPVAIHDLAKLLSVKEDAVREAAKTLKLNLEGRGIVLMEKDDSLALGTSPEMSELIEAMRKEELSRDIGKAGLETLSIILYKGPVSRSEIDYIRGVNSSFILRNLLIRGLIERTTNPSDSRSFLYKPTFDLLSFLGVQQIDALPDYEKVKEELAQFVDAKESLDEAQDKNDEEHGESA